MARKSKILRPPVSSKFRVRMHRQRKKMKEARQILLNTPQNENVLDDIMNVNTSENEEEEQLNLNVKLRDWANSHHISKRAVDSLLNILNCSLLPVPKNHRTLLGTPTQIQINNVAGGKFWYNGLEKCLKQIFCTLDRDIALSLKFNIDGLPLYKSSPISFYPILASIHGL